MMKILLTLILGLLFMNVAVAQKTNPNYDAGLADKLGGDDYGMKSYIFVILKTGKNESQDAELRKKSFSGHMQNINKMVQDGKLVVAGPIEPNKLSYRGIFILNIKTIEEAEKILQTDPAIKEGFLDVELFKWYGSAALPEYLEASDKIWKTGF